MTTQYEEHWNNKSLVRNVQQTDKIMAKTDPSLVFPYFDLHEFLPAPKSFENGMYFKGVSKHSIFSIYNIANKDGFCYIWNESISSRETCEISSCMYDFIYQHYSQGK